MSRHASILMINAVSWIGGAEGAMLDTVTSLDPDRFRCAVVCPEEGHLPTSLRKADIRVEIVPFYGLKARNPARYFETIARLTRIAGQYRTAIIHVNHHYFSNYGIALRRVCRKPVVIHVRGVESDAFYSGYARHIAAADAIVCVSDAARNRLLEYAMKNMPPSQFETIAHRAVTIYDGFRNTVQGITQDELHKHYGIPADKRIVGIVGQVTPEKGLWEFAKAAETILRSASDVHFLIVGTDPDPERRFHDHLKYALQQQGLTDHFTFAGFTTDAAALISGMDVSVLASHQDAFPRVVLESLWASVPIVATAVGGVPEMLQDGVSGVLVPPRDPAQLAQAMLSVLDMPSEERQRMTAAGRQSLSRFSIDRHMDQIHGLYEHLLKLQGWSYG